MVETIIPRELLYIADEVFFTGTAAEITPIRSVDRITGGPGKARSDHGALQKEFFGDRERNGAGPIRLADAGRNREARGVQR